MKLIIKNIIAFIDSNLKLVCNRLQIILCLLSLAIGTIVVINEGYLPTNVILGLIFIMLSLIYLDRER